MTTDAENDKNFIVRISLPNSLKVMFDTSKKEMLNPNKGFKKIV